MASTFWFIYIDTQLMYCVKDKKPYCLSSIRYYANQILCLQEIEAFLPIGSANWTNKRELLYHYMIKTMELSY